MKLRRISVLPLGALRVTAARATVVMWLLACAPLQGDLLDIYNVNSRPVRLALAPSGQVLVSDTQLGSVFLYDQSLTVEGEIKGVYEPLGVAVAPDGRIYVGSQGHRNIRIYLSDGAVFGSMGNLQVSKPNDMVFDFDGNLYVADSSRNRVQVFDSSRRYVRTIGSSGSGDGQLAFPSSVTIGYYRDGGGAMVGELFVADQANHRVQVFDLEGNFLRGFGSEPTMKFGGYNLDGRFARLQSIGLDDQYRLHAVDTEQSKVQVLDSQSGTHIEWYGFFGTGPGELNLPLDMTITDPVSGTQKVVVANNGNGRVETIRMLTGDGVTQMSNNTIPENVAAGTTVGTLSSSAPGGATFMFVPGFGSEGNANFTLDGTTIKSAVTFNHDTTNSYSIRVKALHATSVNLIYAETFTIEVENINEPPTGLSLDDVYVLEGLPVGTAVGNFVTTDDDAVDSFTYELVSGAGDTDNGQFSIDGEQLLTAAVFDYETIDTYSIRVRTTDAGGLSHEQALSVFVWNVIEATDEPDLDVDALPDEWEYNYTGSNTDLAPNEDTDGDGANNKSEFEAGTNPTDPRSVPNISRGTIFILK